MTSWEQDYLDLLKKIMNEGIESEDRTGVGTKSIFGHQIRIDLSKGFPMVTTRQMKLEVALSEILWFLSGSTDERRLAEIRYGKSREELIGRRTIWLENADNQGKSLGYTNTDLIKELGPVYGEQWRNFGGVDQITHLINSIKNNPDSRRHIVSAWNPPLLDKMALPPCHCLFQFYVKNNKLSCQLYARSQDVFLGTPTNIIGYALLTHMIAHVTGLEVGDYIHTFGDTHIYKNHYEAVETQLTRVPKQSPKLLINRNVKDIFDFNMNDFELVDYEHHSAISAPMAV